MRAEDMDMPLEDALGKALPPDQPTDPAESVLRELRAWALRMELNKPRIVFHPDDEHLIREMVAKLPQDLHYQLLASTHVDRGEMLLFRGDARLLDPFPGREVIQ
jgi:hypothetical protein